MRATAIAYIGKQAEVRRPGNLANALRKAKRQGGWAAALELWCKRDSTSQGCDADGAAFTIALTCMAKVGGYCGEASGLLRRMRSRRIHPGHAAIGSAVVACARSGAWEQAFQLLSEAEDWPGGAGTVAYNAVISACGHTHSPQVALRLLSRMREQGVHQSVVTFGAAFGACSKGHAWEEALSLLCDMRHSSGLGVSIDYKAHAAVATACARAAQWRQALELVQLGAADEWGLSGAIAPAAYTAAICACDHAGIWEQAVALFIHMQDRGLQRSTPACNATLSACARSSAWEFALFIWEQASEVGLTDWLAPELTVKACERAGEWIVALALFKEFQGRSMSLGTQAFDAAISACALGRQSHDALMLLQDMSIRGVPMTRTTKNAVLRALEGPDSLHQATAALTLLRAGLGASSTAEWQRQGVPQHLELNEEGLSKAATQVETRAMDRVHSATVPDNNDLVFQHKRTTSKAQDLEISVPASLLKPVEEEFQNRAEWDAVESWRRRVAHEASVALANLGGGSVYVHVVGSQLYGVALRGADVDLVVELPPTAERNLFSASVHANMLQQEDHWRLASVRALLRLRRRLEEETVSKCLRVVDLALDARRPTLRLQSNSLASGASRAMPLEFDVEVTFDQSLSTVAKSELLARFAAAQPEVLQVARFLRLWAERRGLTGQRHGYLSGYAWCLLVVYYLQYRGVVGVLEPRSRSELSGFGSGPLECRVAAAPPQLPSPTASDMSLFIGLFAFYSRSFRWGYEAVDVRVGRRLLKLDPNTGGLHEDRRASAYLSIKDPVESGLDLAIPYLNARRNCRLRAEFRRAHRLSDCGGVRDLWTTLLRRRSHNAESLKNTDVLS